MKKIMAVIILSYIAIFGFINSSYALSGNYQESCKRCQLVNGQLRCLCQTLNGNWDFTSLNNARFCSFIKNIDGRLVCTGSQRLNPLPAGNYQQTCQNCSFDGFRLSCQCQTRDQSQMINTTLNRIGSCQPGSIQNINGVLQCARFPSNVLPAGSYHKTCTNCKFDGSTLTCDCLTRRQTWHYSSTIYDADQCMRVINVNGRLRCRD